jgi:hypothetical protein
MPISDFLYYSRSPGFGESFHIHGFFPQLHYHGSYALDKSDKLPRDHFQCQDLILSLLVELKENMHRMHWCQITYCFIEQLVHQNVYLFQT